MSDLEVARDKIIDAAPRIQQFIEGTGGYETSGGATKETAQDMLARLEAELNGAAAVTATGINRAAAETARDLALGYSTTAENARDAALIQAGVYDDEPAGRAAVADGVAFKVKGSGDIAAYEFRRISAGASTLIASYPSSAIVNRISRAVPPGELLYDGSPTPIDGDVDYRTGYYFRWLDADGVWHDPAVDAQLAAMQAIISASDLSAYATVAIPGMDALVDGKRYDVERTDDDGTKRIAKLIRGDDPDYLLVELTTENVFVYLRVGQPADNYWLRYSWGWAVGSGEHPQDTVQWTDATLVVRDGSNWSFTDAFFFVGGGIQDIVSGEASSGGFSVDNGETVWPEYVGPGHGFEFKTRELQICVDGVAVPAKRPARFLAREVHLSYQAHTFRPRLPFDPLTATVLATVDKTWTVDPRQQLRGRHRITVGAADWTGFTYFPLFTVPRDRPGYTVHDRGTRDWDWSDIALPSGLDSGGGAEPQERLGVREMRYSGPHGGLAIRVGEPMRWSAAGYRRSNGTLPLAYDSHRIKGLPDPDVKSYWTLGGDLVNVAGTDYYRLNAGDRVEREFAVLINKN